MAIDTTQPDSHPEGSSPVEMMVGETEQKVVLIDLPHGPRLVWSVILFIAQVGLYWNRKRGRGPRTLLQLIRGLDLRFLDAVAHTYYQVDASRYTYTLESWVKFLFVGKLFDLDQEALLDFLKNPAHRAWQRVIGWTEVPSPSRVSEFKQRVHPAILPWALAVLRDQVYQAVQAERLSEVDLLAYARRRTLVRPKVYVGRIGFNLFCNFIDGLGIVAELVACLSNPADNVTYHRQDIVLALLHRVVNEAKNTHQLAGKLRNEQGLGHLDQVPCRVTLGKGFQEFDAAQLKALNERLMKRTRRWRHGQRLRVGIDSSLIEVRGEHEHAENTVDPHTGRYERAYKLFAACDLESKDVLYLHLEPGNTADSRQLLQVAQAVQHLVSPTPVEWILFDRGFYKQASFEVLNQGEAPQWFITPGKKYKTLVEAVEAIEETEYRAYEPELTPHQKEKQARQKLSTLEKRTAQQQQELAAKGTPPKIAERALELEGYTGGLRLIVVQDKRLKKTKVKNAAGTRYERDEDGDIVIQEVWEPVYFTYLTNIPKERLTAESVVTTYKSRWSVEDLFEELKNDWGLKYFPSTDDNTVQAHIYFLFILYAAVNLFKRLLLGGKFARQMLGTLQVEVLQAPHPVFARWLTTLEVAFDPGDGVADLIQFLRECGHFRIQLYQSGASP